VPAHVFGTSPRIARTDEYGLTVGRSHPQSINGALDAPDRLAITVVNPQTGQMISVPCEKKR
jgi:hypothetical protein